METFILVAVVAVWICLVLPAVVIPLLPRNPEARPVRAPRPTGPFTLLPPSAPGDTTGGQAVA